MVCDPNIYGGNFVQTLFLGATIANYSATLGWNSTLTEVQVLLVEDKCSSSTGKLYYDGCGNPQIHYGPDYFNPPPLGYPVLFIFGSFSFCGVLQNWKYIIDAGGKKISARITAPTEILAGTSIILNGYNGPVFGIPNLINVYSFLEAYNGIPVLYDEQMHALLGYTPVTGFGGSAKNEAGIPWNLVRSALNLIINTGANSNFGSKLKLRDVSYYLDISELPILDGYRITGDNKDLLSLITEICDLSGRDFYLELQLVQIEGGTCANNEYSEVGDISGRLNPTLWAFIKVRTVHRVNQPQPAKLVDSSVDVPLEARLGQGAITSYANGLQTQNLDRGIELRPEVTNAMLVGDYRQDIFQIPFTDTHTVVGSVDVTSLPNNYTASIFHYWGKDENGFPLPSRGLNGNHIVWFNILYKFDPTTELAIYNAIQNGINTNPGTYSLGAWAEPAFVLFRGGLTDGNKIKAREALKNYQTDVANHWRIQSPQYQVKFGKPQFGRYLTNVGTGQQYWQDYIVQTVRVIDPSYYYQSEANFLSAYSYPVEAPEMLMALIGFDEWVAWMRNFASTWKKDLIEVLLRHCTFGSTTGIEILKKRYSKLRKSNRLKDMSLAQAILSGILNPEDGHDMRDGAQKLYDYIKQLVEKHYGRTFAIMVNDLRSVPDNTEPYGSRLNYTVTQTGWTDASHLLGLPANSTDLALFKDDETGKVYGFALMDSVLHMSPADPLNILTYNSSFLDLTNFKTEDYIFINEHEAYVRFTVEEIVYLDPVAKARPRVIISFPDRVFTSHISVISQTDANGNPLFVDSNGNSLVKVTDWKTSALQTLTSSIYARMTVGSDAVVAGALPLPAFPYIVALPMQSNELSYGPWVATSNGSNVIVDANKTEYIKDGNLNPWNYGNTANMNYAGWTSVNSKIVRQNVVEFGNFTLPGLPRFTLGQVAIGTGPELTDFSITFGPEGMTTTYGMKTYTPNYGTIGKTRIDSMKKIGSNITKTITSMQKSLAERKTWTKFGQSAISRMLARNDASIRTSSSSFILGDSQIEWYPSGELTSNGVSVPGVGNVAFDDYTYGLFDIGNKENVVVITDVRKCLPEFAASIDSEYQKRAGVCTEGIFRPYSTYIADTNFSHYSSGIKFFLGSGDMVYRGIPATGVPSASGYGQYGYYNYSNNFSKFGTPPVSGIGQPPINCWTTNPFLEGSGLTFDPNVSGFALSLYYKGHDIEYVVRDGTYPVDLSVRSPYDNYSTAGWYRAIGIKTPIILTGWGYDIDGYPTPNKYGDTNRGASFEDDWLRKPHHWKTGPLDVRWDNNRGVWTCPSPLPVVRIQASEASTSGTFRAKLMTSVSAFTPSGTTISSKDIIVHNNVNFTMSSGSLGYALFNPNDYYNDINYSKYELLAGGNSNLISFILRTDLVNGGCAIAEETVMSSSGILGANGHTFPVYDRLAEFYGYADVSCGFATIMSDTPSSGICTGLGSVTDTQLREITRLTCPTFIGCPCATP